MFEIFYYNSPIGTLEIKLQIDIVVGLKVIESKEKTSLKTGYFAIISKQLDEYFSANRKEFNLKINLKGTDFQKKVWAEIQKIPYGKTKSYQEIAEIVGKPNAQRAVGMACNKNPILLFVPCHRVISKSGKLTGFACGLNAKEVLLKLERAFTRSD